MVGQPPYLSLHSRHRPRSRDHASVDILVRIEDSTDEVARKIGSLREGEVGSAEVVASFAERSFDDTAYCRILGVERAHANLLLEHDRLLLDRLDSRRGPFAPWWRHINQSQWNVATHLTVLAAREDAQKVLGLEVGVRQQVVIEAAVEIARLVVRLHEVGFMDEAGEPLTRERDTQLGCLCCVRLGGLQLELLEHTRHPPLVIHEEARLLDSDLAFLLGDLVLLVCLAASEDRNDLAHRPRIADCHCRTRLAR